MSPFQTLRQKLEADGFSPSETKWGDARVLMGQKRTFKWRWLATALWENVVAYKVTTLDEPDLTDLIEQAKRWAISNKRGWMRGLQSGQAVVVVVVADRITDSARQLAAKAWEIEFARFTVVAITDGKVPTIAKGPKAVGVVYRPHLTNRLKSLAIP